MTQNDDINVCQFVIIYSVHSNQSSAINLNCIHSTLAVCVCVCVANRHLHFVSEIHETQYASFCECHFEHHYEH